MDGATSSAAVLLPDSPGEPGTSSRFSQIGEHIVSVSSCSGGLAATTVAPHHVTSAASHPPLDPSSTSYHGSDTNAAWLAAPSSLAVRQLGMQQEQQQQLRHSQQRHLHHLQHQEQQTPGHHSIYSSGSGSSSSSTPRPSSLPCRRHRPSLLVSHAMARGGMPSMHPL
jgi:hypothetical protein